MMPEYVFSVTVDPQTLSQRSGMLVCCWCFGVMATVTKGREKNAQQQQPCAYCSLAYPYQRRYRLTLRIPTDV